MPLALYYNSGRFRGSEQNAGWGGGYLHQNKFVTFNAAVASGRHRDCPSDGSGQNPAEMDCPAGHPAGHPAGRLGDRLGGH